MIMAQKQRTKHNSDGDGRKAASNKERSKAINAVLCHRPSCSFARGAHSQHIVLV